MKKIYYSVLAVVFISICSAGTLNIAVDENRFLDEVANTILEINYQISYRDLKFSKTAQGFEATLEADFSILKDEQIVYTDLLTNKIIVTDEAKTRSNMQFTDKLALTLSKSGFHFLINFRDVVSENTAIWEYDFVLLPPNSLLSDLELSFEVVPDSSQYLEKFHRGNQLYRLNASHVFSLFDSEKVFIYGELYNFARDSLGFSDLQEEIFLKKKAEIISAQTNQISSKESFISRTHLIPIADLADGYYDLEIKLTDKITGDVQTITDFFSLKKPVLFTERMFVELDDEFKLISYFLAGAQIKTWKTLSEEGRINFLNRFWTQNDPDPMTEKNEFFEEIQERVVYCNKNFSHFDKGWSTDLGRVYLRNGQPDEVLELDTGLYTKYSQKEYVIWKYRTRANKTYIFIDLQTSGNFRMIYADGDMSESSAANWQDYLGEDFDANLLE